MLDIIAEEKGEKVRAACTFSTKMNTLLSNFCLTSHEIFFGHLVLFLFLFNKS